MASVRAGYFRNNLAESEPQLVHRASLAREVLLHSFKFEDEHRYAPINRSKDRESRVLVLYTGGTIGMMKNDHNAYVPTHNAFEKYIRRIPYMHDQDYADAKLSPSDRSKFLVLPEAMEKTRVLYHILEYSELLDSSNMAMDGWIQIAMDIQPIPVEDRESVSTAPPRIWGDRRVLVIYTGGTIGMKPDDSDALVPVPKALQEFLRRIPFMHDRSYADMILDDRNKEKYLVCPASFDSYRILYRIKEYSPLLDSSNMTLKEWITIAEDVKVSPGFRFFKYIFNCCKYP